MLPKPIILVNNSSSSANTKSYYQNRYGNADKVYVFGGIAIVSDKAVQNLSDNSITNSADDTAGFSKLYTEDGIGEYLGFKKIMGYTDSNKFAVYFKGTSSSYQVSVTDLRGLNDNEIVTWIHRRSSSDYPERIERLALLNRNIQSVLGLAK